MIPVKVFSQQSRASAGLWLRGTALRDRECDTAELECLASGERLGAEAWRLSLTRLV